MFKGIRKISSLICFALFGMFTMVSSSFASPVVQDLWDAVDVTTVSGQVITLLTAMVGIRLGFLVYKYVKRVMGAA